MDLELLQIRKANPIEIDRLIHYQQQMAWETEELELDATILRKGIQRLFDDPVKGIYWVFEYENDVIGCVLTLTEWSDWRNGDVLWIHSLFVEKEFRGKGVFRNVYSTFQDKVRKDAELRGLRLYVEKENIAAQKAYQAVGMTKEHYELYEWLEE